ncbi:hypothetical protein B0H15DRAFT_911624 [Mycena belliarum]|uniref:Peroxisomal biogenesis factor 11 n=1 Tax=Mycena belliarum TaxID=1033014 RepID=A0AAD6U3P8_9AGAR|nr:hypothetical protein B0H15DRAFT_911624 [Mycena belliae]
MTDPYEKGRAPLRTGIDDLPPSTRLDDLVLGAVGARIPPSATLNHALRYLATWGGTDSQYALKLLAPFLLYRARVQFRAGKRAGAGLGAARQTHDALLQVAGQLSVARRLMGFWGILSFLRSLSLLERAPPLSRATLNLQRLQGLAMLAFYPLEYAAFFSAPFAGPLLRLSAPAALRAQLWSVRAWGVYVALKVAELGHEWGGLVAKEREMERVLAAKGEGEGGGGQEGEGEGEGKAVRRRKYAIAYQLAANVSRLPVIVHWSVVGGIYQNEIWSAVLSLISALVSFSGGWEASRIPAPMR